MIFLNHIYQNMILDRLLIIMTLDIVYTFSIYDIKKISHLPNRSKRSLNLANPSPIIAMGMLLFLLIIFFLLAVMDQGDLI